MYCDIDNPLQSPVCNIQIIEALDSRSTTASKTGEAWDLHFYVRGTNDECAIRARLEPGKPYGLPRTFPPQVGTGMGGVLQSYPLQEYTVTNLGWQLWEVRARYAWAGAVNRNVFRVTLPTQISMSTRGGNIKLASSIRTVQSYPQEENPGGKAETPAPNFENAIEWDGKRVKGVQVPSPITRYSEVWIFPSNRIFSPVGTGEQKQDGSGDGEPIRTDWQSRLNVWEDYTGTVHGTVNQKPRETISEGDKSPQEQAEDNRYKNESEQSKQKFRGWSPGEILLDNVNLRQVGLHHFEVSFDFLVKSNSKGFTLPWSVEDYGTESRPIDGWDYIWTYNEFKSVTANSELAVEQQYKLNAPIPLFIYVERIMERRNFVQLDIGNAPFSSAIIDPCSSSVDLMNIWDQRCKRTNPRGG